MPAPRELSRVNEVYIRLLASAAKEKIRIDFQPEELNKFISTNMQLNNAIMLFKKTDPQAKDGPRFIPEHLRELTQYAVFLGTELNRAECFLEIGKAHEVGTAGLLEKRLQESLQKANRTLDTSLLVSQKTLRTVAAIQGGLLNDLPPFDPDSAKELGPSAQPTTSKEAKEVPERTQQELLDVLTGKKEL